MLCLTPARSRTLQRFRRSVDLFICRYAELRSLQERCLDLLSAGERAAAEARVEAMCSQGDMPGAKAEVARSIELISKLGRGVGMDVAGRLWGVIERAETVVKARGLVEGAAGAVGKGRAGEARSRLDEAATAYAAAGG